MSNYYLGTSPENILGSTPRYFYALRKNENGSLYFVKNDNIKDGQVIDINVSGNLEDNYTDFEVGVDFFEGINVNHEQMFDNLKYSQYRWDNRPIFYYIDEEGQLVARINQGYTYPTGVAEE
jgi:hypothetical protein